ncbi:protein of unknown function [Agrobacterium pusense]|uniref:Uncharacterized protein n=1 Tax=Agrobacterium pusense TaxID=648995 RepID=U4PZ82_9HYPH|nr:protein of unknown function [Agrobacterium pusense]
MTRNHHSPFVPSWMSMPISGGNGGRESRCFVRKRWKFGHNSAVVTLDGSGAGGARRYRLRHNRARNVKKYNKTEKLSKGFTQYLEKIRIKSQ